MRSVRAPIAAILFLLALRAPVVRGQETTVRLDPANTTIGFTLGATLHSVHGTFKLKSGEIHVDPMTGKASGAIVVDATSGNSDNTSRDEKMHKDVLESSKFIEIVFSPTQLTAPAGHTVKETLETRGSSQLEAAGIFRLHGQEHNTTLSLAIDNGGDGRVQVSGKLSIPYIKWGLKSPNTFLLHVSDTVDVEIRSSGQILAAR